MTSMDDFDRVPTDRLIADWLTARAPGPVPPDLPTRIAAVTQAIAPRPAWLARRVGHHLASRGRRTGDRDRRWLLVLGVIGVSVSVVAALAVGRAPDERPAIVPPISTIAPSVAPSVEPSVEPITNASPVPTSTPVPTPRPVPPFARLVRYVDPDDGYELLMPKAWEQTATGEADVVESKRGPGVRWFGYGWSVFGGGQPALSISIGATDGSLTLCRSTCETVVVHTVDQLEKALVSSPASDASYETRGETMLGGKPARFEGAAVTLTTEASGRWAMYHVFTIHDKRPIVLAFAFWNVRWQTLGPADTTGGLSPAVFDEILASFRYPD